MSVSPSTPPSPPPSSYIYSTGAAFGNHYTTEEVLQALIRQQTAQHNTKDDNVDRDSPSTLESLASQLKTTSNSNEDSAGKNKSGSNDTNNTFDIEFASRVLAKCGFDYHSFVLPLSDLFRRFTREEYLAHRRKHLLGLAERAGKEALERWGGRLDEITHLFWGTMTGAMDSPTIDIQLAKNLGLSLDVERTNIEGMGCLTGFRLLNLARQVALGDPEARILVVAGDLRSALGNCMPSNPTKADIVAVSLFRDGASAAVVGGYSGNNPSPTASPNSTRPRYEIVTGLSRIIEGTSHLVDYYETNEGAIRLNLDKRLPENVGKVEPDFVSTLLAKGRKVLRNRKHLDENLPTMSNLKDMDILCHTGGPRILKEVANSLGVDSKQNLYSSWEVMKNNGNLSGASNLSVVNHHSMLSQLNSEKGGGGGDATTNPTMRHRTSEWAVCISMGPGVCLEGVLLRDVGYKAAANLPMFRSLEEVSNSIVDAVTTRDARNAGMDTRKVVHIVGGGIAGLTLAAALNPEQYKIRIFEASDQIQEKGYGLAIWPSTMKILRDKLGITELDLRTSKSMAINRKSLKQKLEIRPPREIPDKGFMKRSSLLRRLLSRVEEVHPGCISTDHKCLRVRFGSNEVAATYESNGSTVTYACDLLVGADGVNSVVRKYVSLDLDSRVYGHMTAYRFLVPFPSDELLKQTERTWNMSISDSIHSPCYHISNDNSALNIVVLEYDGKAPSQPRAASMAELRDVVKRSNMQFIMNILDTETIDDLMCYSTFHVDSKPWHQPQAVIIGDAAHAYGPLTAKMANLAINDAHALGTILNVQKGGDLSQGLCEWELAQRPKFEVTRIRTLRHLQLYSPKMRNLSGFLWKHLPNMSARYFGSIFAYDYEIYSQTSEVMDSKVSATCRGILGVKDADPLSALLKMW
eukprot:CAMPEP_0183717160 /NCGR_PEP_ID=MMETSP0737-20130205/10847_1 /TAXON_ID=385413 /ORGANISM="Thalassiosira miniscula, Strain CCMP1093" /LENGTH=918 /DNA_ID=CAMNT_0025946547 /DNA_START=104 /DNA_END=2857 /DNA_ORIENTATION=-